VNATKASNENINARMLSHLMRNYLKSIGLSSIFIF
jgi:hypothetical protein